MSQSPLASTSRLPTMRTDAVAQLPLTYTHTSMAASPNYFLATHQDDTNQSSPMPTLPLASTSAASDRSPSVEGTEGSEGSNKKRGPKTRPGADDRRRELHRRAQKSHREKKETHMKDLEDQVNGLPESYTQIFTTMHRVCEDNNTMRVAMGQDPSNLGNIIRSTPLKDIYERYYGQGAIPQNTANPTTSAAPPNPTPIPIVPNSSAAGPSLPPAPPNERGPN